MGKFLGIAVAVLIALSAIAIAFSSSTQPAVPMPAFASKAKILFQGDSITDMNRGRSEDPNHILGHSYAFLIGAKFGCEFPERRLTFINRGISGNTVADLQKRWKTDALDLKPDILSILIGINDLDKNVPVDEYQKQYDDLLAQTVKSLPKTRLVLCEPFGLPVGKYKNGWDQRRSELLARQAVVAKLGEKYHAIVVHLQKAFDQACERAPADYWIWDGIHPTYSGQQLLADEWVRAVAAEK